MEKITLSKIEKEVTLKSFLTSHVTGIDILAGIVIVLLAMLSAYFFLAYKDVGQELVRVQSRQTAAATNTKVLAFTQLFIDKVLKADNEIDFETRLKLESAVRDLEDEEILASWQRFTTSATERDAQWAVKNLLGLLVSRIQ